jgi:hypothetical protein
VTQNGLHIENFHCGRHFVTSSDFDTFALQSTEKTQKRGIATEWLLATGCKKNYTLAHIICGKVSTFEQLTHQT